MAGKKKEVAAGQLIPFRLWKDSTDIAEYLNKSSNFNEEINNILIKHFRGDDRATGIPSPALAAFDVKPLYYLLEQMRSLEVQMQNAITRYETAAQSPVSLETRDQTSAGLEFAGGAFDPSAILSRLRELEAAVGAQNVAAEPRTADLQQTDAGLGETRFPKLQKQEENKAEPEPAMTERKEEREAAESPSSIEFKPDPDRLDPVPERDPSGDDQVKEDDPDETARILDGLLDF